MGMLDWTERSADVLQQGGVIGPDERLPWPQTAVMGVQHVIAHRLLNLDALLPELGTQSRNFH